MRLGLGAVIDEFKEFAIDKQIPVITASQMNREATSKVDDGRKNRTVDLVRNLGRNNIGESLLILENADAAFIITPETTKFGKKYLGVSSVKTRYKGASLFTFFQPYNNERPIELEQDTNLAQPVFKDTLVEMTQSNSESYDNKSMKSIDKSDDEEIKEGLKHAKEEAKKLEKKDGGLFNKKRVLKETNTPAEAISSGSVIDNTARNAIFGIKKKKPAFIVFSTEKVE